jgi:hypothetical protein
MLAIIMIIFKLFSLPKLAHIPPIRSPAAAHLLIGSHKYDTLGAKESAEGAKRTQQLTALMTITEANSATL